MNNAAELQAAAEKLRPSSPAVATHTVAVRIPPAAAEALADWLGCLAMLDPTERDAETCGWCSANHPAAVARALNAA
ncbi:hypothetical protein PV728_48035 [Streptomyces europaeiscabiei]|uniref:hypothetical protein n=1 Tax=Streptomyces europaeiscabiei TaxID=146819 RepID=UPI0029B81368|nr:hypothetical protein [Streptomyces europaeiscabiei]MDX3637788.1 hypothetical protein [Streptomyces europaeiscabiei]MDX3637801.1 hypothetical protein [Streptomyces europaeiscabiei]MDX3655600.1 hypothetical protein [Streptomyces europaeiscabiei]MDX3655613.1 hypothetical protein [Streptomyces europaeiscabiei]